MKRRNNLFIDCTKRRWVVVGSLFIASMLCPLSHANIQSQNSINNVKLTLKQDHAAALRLKAWKALLQDRKPKTVANVLKEVNDFFNRLTYIPEDPLQGSADIWLTPYEFLAAGGGDCEDFAIAKYFTLVTMGIPEQKLRITYVSIPNQNKPHMVLTYYPTPDAEPLILDNIIGKILLSSQRPDLVPIYSFNGGAVWLNERIGKARPYGSVKDLSKWQALLQRIKLEEEN